MTQKKILLPLLSLAGGAVGFGLRRWQLSAGFEADTGLAIPYAPSGLALLGWSLAIVLALAFLCWSSRDLPAHLEGGKGSTPYLTLVMASGMLLLVSASLDGMTLFSSTQTSASSDYLLIRAASAVLPPLRALLSLGGLVCAGLWGRSVYRGSTERSENLALLELCLLVSVWLISDYQSRAADPVVQAYLYDILAIITALLGLYYLAGFSFHEPHPRRALFFTLTGPYFCLVTMADAHATKDLFRLGFAALFLIAHAMFVLLDLNPPTGENT